MSEGIAEEFFYLQADPRLSDTQLLTREVHAGTKGNVLIAMDTFGHRHLLVTENGPGAQSGVPDASDNLVLGARNHDGTGYVDLVCKNDALGLVFERLCADVVTRAQDEPDMHPNKALIRALDDWQALFERTPAALSREEQIGLFGELLVLERLAQTDPVKALGAWSGPGKSLRDFSSEKAFMEVKCTTSQDAKRVSISSLDQLDPAAGEPLFLVLVSLTVDTTGDSTDVLIERLVDAGVPRHALERKVAQYGYSFSSRGTDPKFSVKGLTFWAVQESSPGLRRSDIPSERVQGVEKVTYTLAVESLGVPLNDDDIQDVLALCAG